MNPRVRTAAYCIVLCIAFTSLVARSYFDGKPGLALFFACIGELLAIGAGLNLWLARGLLKVPETDPSGNNRGASK
jgi:hypothetical protein